MIAFYYYMIWKITKYRSEKRIDLYKVAKDQSDKGIDLYKNYGIASLSDKKMKVLIW